MITGNTYSEVKASLLYLKSLGLDGVACSPDALDILKGFGAEKRKAAPAFKPSQPKKAVAAASFSTPSSPSRVEDQASQVVEPIFLGHGVTGPVEDTMGSIIADMGECTRCSLFRGRERIVFGSGNPNARLMIIGDMPLAEEGHQGLPFLGASGDLLNKMLSAMGFSREDVYLSNILKCCPQPGREKPDFTMCLSFLERQIAVVRPEVILTMGAVAAQVLLGLTTGVAEIRGQFQNYRGIRLMPTFHPTFLLRHPDRKRDAWRDLQQVMQVLRLPRGGHR